VTTYGTVIDVPNNQLKLKPGMTANVKVEISKRTDVLRIPNAALRFRPTTDVFAALNQQVPPEAQSGGNRARGGRNAQGGGAAGPSTTPAAAPAGTASTSGTASAQGASAANSQGGDQSGGRRGFDPARMMERFKSMSPDEQKQLIARLKDRGQDATAFEQAMVSAAKPADPKSPSSAAALKTKYGAAAPAQTIDALFAPLPSVETRGRAWLFMNQELKPVNLRLGISDGTNTEILSGELQPNMEVVTGVTGLGTTRAQPGQGSGNPLMPGRGGFGGPGGRGR
jgi:HlyD family secretion protein